jgi:hypothetical protein
MASSSSCRRPASLLDLRLQQIWRYVRGIKRIGIIITIGRSETGEGTLHTVTLAGQ